MNFTKKVDVLDLVISTLREHEKALDELTRRLEKALERVENVDDRELMRRFYT